MNRPTTDKQSPDHAASLNQTTDFEPNPSDANASTQPIYNAAESTQQTKALPKESLETTGFEQVTLVHVQNLDAEATQDFDDAARDLAQQLPNLRRISIAGYEVLGELGRGAMGVVYKAHHTRSDRIVALKVLINIDHAQPKEIERFEIEAKAAARLQHPNIVQVYDVGQAGDLPYFTQEFISGGTLAHLIAKTMLSHQQAAQMMLVLAKAVAFAHSRGIVHRDLKPANILMVDSDTPKIADFGLARRMEDETHLTKDGTILGTPAYMAPEQAYGSSQEIGPHSDIYTLGAILYELLVGRPPFKGSSAWQVIEMVRSAEPVRPSEIERSIPRDIETICLKCLNKDPAKRYESAQALAEDLQRTINHEPILARPVGRVERFVRLCRRHPSEAKLIGAVAALLVLITGGSVWTAMRINHDRNRIQQEQEISNNRLKSRNEAIFQVVNRAPQKVEDLPLSQAANRLLAQLTEEVLEAEAESLKNDKATESSRKWGLAGASLGRGKLALRLYNDALSKGAKPDELELLYKEAEKHFQTAHQLAKEVYDSGQGDRAKANGNMALTLDSLAGLYSVTGRGSDPIPLMTQAIDLRRAAVAEPVAEDSVSKRRASLARTESDMVQFQLKQLQKANASERVKLATELLARIQAVCMELEDIIKDDTIDADLLQTIKRDLCLAAHNMADCARIAQDNSAIEQGYTTAMRVAQELVKADPDNFRFQLNLLDIANNFGDFCLVQQRDPTKARGQYVVAMTTIRELMKDRVLTQLNSTWLMEYYRLGLVAGASQNAEQKRKYFERAALICDIQLRQMEDVKADVDSFKVWNQRCLLMLIQAWAGQVEPAASMARRVTERFAKDEKNSERPEFLARAAFALGLAAQAVPEDRREAAQAAALEAMRTAIQAGYNNLEYLKTDPDVSGLRAIDGFDKLLVDIETQVIKP